MTTNVEDRARTFGEAWASEHLDAPAELALIAELPDTDDDDLAGFLDGVRRVVGTAT